MPAPTPPTPLTLAAAVDVADSGLLLGALLVAALLGGMLARMIHLPKVVGYLIAGAGVGTIVTSGWFEPATIKVAKEPLTLLKDLGLGLIIFSLGSVFEVSHMRAVGSRVLKLVVAESGLTLVLVALTTTIAALASGFGTGPAIALGILLGIAAMETAPAATVFVLRAYEAKGSVSDSILSVTGFNNALVVLCFFTTFLILTGAGTLGDSQLTQGDVWFGLMLLLIGSPALGLVTGLVVSVVHARAAAPDTAVLLVALLLGLSSGEAWLLETYGVGYSALLATIIAGAVYSNVAIDPERLDGTVAVISRPVVIAFFVLAGLNVKIESLLDMGWIGIAYLVARLIGKMGGAWLGVRWVGQDRELPGYFGAGLLCQAGLILGCVGFVDKNADAEIAKTFAAVAFGAIALFETGGAILVKITAVRAGEVKAITLIHHRPGPDSRSLLRLTLVSLARTVGFAKPKPSAQASQDAIEAKHLMRTNVKCLPSAAAFDEVLRFVERSRFNHFPVVNAGGDLVGVIHFSDIRGLLYDPELSNLLTAADLAATDTGAIEASMPLRELLDEFQRREIGWLPIVEGSGSRKLLGIVEQRDVLAAARQAHLR